MKKSLILLLISILFVSGCSLSFGKKKVTNLGVYKSSDYGETWEQKAFAGVTKKKQKITIAGVNITRLSLHPKNPNIIYLCTLGHGIYKTEDGGELWLKTGAGEGTYVNLVIDPQNQDIVYTANSSQISKSIDAGKTWETIYYETQEGQKITDIAVDHENSKHVYAVTNKGAFLKSLDYGVSWHVAQRFDQSLKRIYFSPIDSRAIYLVTQKAGLYQSLDGGSSWKYIYEQLKQINKKSVSINGLAFFQENPQIMYLATEYGLIKTTDAGENFAIVETLLKVGFDIDTIVLDPDIDSNIYITIGNKLHKSIDRGENWKTILLPTANIVSDLILDPINTYTIYVGIIK